MVERRSQELRVGGHGVGGRLPRADQSSRLTSGNRNVFPRVAGTRRVQDALERADDVRDRLLKRLAKVRAR